MEMKVISDGGKKVNALFMGFLVETDQSIQDGGDGSAPSPMGLFQASIGTCAGINVFAFCQNRKIPTDDITLTLNFNRDPATNMIVTVAVDIALPADFPDKYRDALTRVVDLCAVKKHLLNPPAFEINIKKQE